MARQKVTKKDIVETLHNMNVELYGVEEALGHAGQDPDSLTTLKISLADLIEEVEKMTLDAPIEFTAPTPALPLMSAKDSRVNPLRKGVC
jgi:hypothetical protein